MDRAELARALGATFTRGEVGSTAQVIAAADATTFARDFAAATAGNGPVFLADPDWTAAQRAELQLLLRVQPPADRGGTNELGWLMIASGGTGGRLKFARHDQATLAAAVRGFTTHFGLSRVNAVGVLPLHHVSGFMAWIRCALTGGEYVHCDWTRLAAGDRPAQRTDEPWVLSLVPTQLQRLLGSPEAVAWLRGFTAIFIGGGPTWIDLSAAAAEAGLPISLSYGMTETAAMVTALRPSEFLAGERSAGSVMPHARIRIDTEEGVVRVAGDSVFRGYWPEWRGEREFVTEDLGSVDEQGHLHVSGRRDAVIITGGKKVQPADVESALRASGEFSDVVVVGVADPEWGEAVVACYPSESGRSPDVARAVEQLSAVQRPKQFIALADWPRTSQGKVNRPALRAMIEARMKPQTSWFTRF